MRRTTAARWGRAARRAGDMRPADAFARPRPVLGVLLGAFRTWGRYQLDTGRATPAGWAPGSGPRAERGRHA